MTSSRYSGSDLCTSVTSENQFSKSFRCFFFYFYFLVLPGETAMDVAEAQKEMEKKHVRRTHHVCFCVRVSCGPNRPRAPHGVTASLTYMPPTLPPWEERASIQPAGDTDRAPSHRNTRRCTRGHMHGQINAPKHICSSLTHLHAQKTPLLVEAKKRRRSNLQRMAVISFFLSS